ncbi:MAG: TlpA disulfide reductase family protein, partial [Planctomycetaceae bacterium]
MPICTCSCEASARSIAELKGRYVLMHVWASWCAPCVEHMPDVQAAAQSLSDQPITFVGLNI